MNEIREKLSLGIFTYFRVFTLLYPLSLRSPLLESRQPFHLEQDYISYLLSTRGRRTKTLEKGFVYLYTGLTL